ncbi:uncharacterized protein LOC103722143 isoform X1 [Phoenix dactylifera]|uniref:Uncharacterized protein LOC103722143 isoform X1 n=1 Tax=Phoenix dactylifera TaxID=42345 RepID=A0A8B7D131_PHODC|nr:uncharacterized protein LOC103722143 isoform X1 [Phoenix dactylifera]
MVMKKGRRVAMESSPSSASYLVGEDARAWFRHQSLLQDYEELLKETEAKRKQLQKAHQKKLKLLAEVRFLRKRYRCLMKNPSQKTTYRLKKQSPKIPAQVVCHGRASNPVTQEQVHQKDRSYIGREAAVPSTSAVLDLNQVSSPNGEEMKEFQVQWEPLKVGKLNKCSTEGDLAANDLRLSICRDVGKGVNRAGKRKLTWQDHVALKV